MNSLPAYSRLITASLLMAAMALPLTVAAQTPPPNILLVIADDMGLDASHCYNIGSQQAPMPILETLCTEGLVFDNAYATPVCSPTRATIMSGQYGHQTGIGGAVSSRAQSGGLSESVVSLFDLLKDAGHSTALIGKWHLASGGDGLDHPKSLGVENYFGLYTGRSDDYYNWQAVENGKQLQVNEYSTTAFTDRAIDWISEQNKPWFLWLAYNAPHTPFHVPPADLHSFEQLKDDNTAIKSNPLPYYQAMLEALDTELGRLLDSLSTDVRRNTIVIFIGDNGTPNQVAKSVYTGHGAKGSLYESGINVPLIVAGTGVKAGRTDAFVSSTDLYATIASLAGASGKTNASYDFFRVLQGGNTNRDYIYAEHFSERAIRGSDTHGWTMRQNNMKLVSIDGETEALYYLQSDPNEQQNLLASNPAPEALAIAKALTERKLLLK